MRPSLVLLLISFLTSLALISCSDNTSPSDSENDDGAFKLSLQRDSWTLASVPTDSIRIGSTPAIEVLASTRALGCYWRQPPSAASRYDFDPNLAGEDGDIEVPILRVRVPVNLAEEELAGFPQLAEVESFHTALGDSIWTGLMQVTLDYPLDLSGQEYLEVWVNDYQQDQEHRIGKVHFDFGFIDEDYWRPRLNELDTEDYPAANGVLDEDEDTGLDGIFDPLEHPDNWGPYGSPQDPAGDNFDERMQVQELEDSFYKINGMEGNGRLDTEDLDGNGYLTQHNYYYSLSLDLSEAPIMDMVEEFTSATGVPPQDDKAWRLYRLDLAEAVIRGEPVGDLDWDQINGVRFWIDGFNASSHDPEQPLNRLEIASLKFAGEALPPWR